MRYLFTIFFYASSCIYANAQQVNIDSLKSLLNLETNDSLRIVYHKSLCLAYYDIKPDSALYYTNEGLQVAIDAGDIKRQSQFLTLKGNILKKKAVYPQALENHLESLKLSESINDQVGIGASYN